LLKQWKLIRNDSSCVLKGNRKIIVSIKDRSTNFCLTHNVQKNQSFILWKGGNDWLTNFLLRYALRLCSRPKEIIAFFSIIKNDNNECINNCATICIIQLMYRWFVSTEGIYNTQWGTRRGAAAHDSESRKWTFRGADTSIRGWRVVFSSLFVSLSLSFSPGQTQVAGRPDNARLLDKAPLIVPISDEEWTASLPLTISFVICIRLIKITMSAKPRRCCAARRWRSTAINGKRSRGWCRCDVSLVIFFRTAYTGVKDIIALHRATSIGVMLTLFSQAVLLSAISDHEIEFISREETKKCCDTNLS